MKSITNSSTLGWASAAAAAMLVLGIAVGAHAVDPAKKSNMDWITLSGTIVSVADEAFRLDYGGGVILVEMDDWDAFKEGKSLLLNDKVTVYGRIDKDRYESRKIEANSVYVESLGTYFHASSADEEDLGAWTMSAPLVVGDLEVVGTVASIDGREITLASGMQIDTIQLKYNPLDDKGFQRIRPGDRIKVHGHLDYDLFERTELMAEWIVSLDNGN